MESMAVRLDQLLENNRKDIHKYLCPKCDYVLRDAVQQMSCGHWLCKCCAEELSLSESPQCPLQDCKELWNIEEQPTYFPDRFVRKSLAKLSVKCAKTECQWIGVAEQLTQHCSVECEFTQIQCKLCDECFKASEAKTHKEVCAGPKTLCCFAELGCDHQQKMTREQRIAHMSEPKAHMDHMEIIAKHLTGSKNTSCVQDDFVDSKISQPIAQEDHEPDYTTAIVIPSIPTHAGLLQQSKLNYMHNAEFSQQVAQLAESPTHLTEMLQTYDGTFIWRIPEIEKHMNKGEFYSPTFYSSGDGYKMRLHLHVPSGDGIGEETHLSIFLTIMKGEFDAILQWPFTHKVSFRLINRHRGRDVVDVFQPDPMSSSFQRPKTDMNVASGCPRFISLAELNQGGFMEDNTIFIKVKVDASTMKH